MRKEKKIYAVLPADTNAARPREGTVKLWRMCTRHQGGLDSVKTCFLGSISLYHRYCWYNVWCMGKSLLAVRRKSQYNDYTYLLMNFATDVINNIYSCKCIQLQVTIYYGISFLPVFGIIVFRISLLFFFSLSLSLSILMY